MTAQRGARRRRSRNVAFSIFTVLALLLSACGGSDDGGGGSSAEDEGEPQRGGKVTYGLEAESSGGYCLPESQLAISGIMVARTLFDTLVVPNEEGEYVPWLAESVEHNEAYDEWTITLKEGVKFHDGSDLTAEVVKNNLDAYRGQYEGRNPLLFVFVFENIDTVTVEDPLTVKVTTKVPWVGFDAALYTSGRVGMVAQAQLDDTETCDTKPIGTGPFKLKEWSVNERLVAEKNPDYWLEAPDGQPYPYLDEIEFQPITEGAQRVNALLGGQVNAIHTSGAQEITKLRDAGTQVKLTESDKFTEVSYTMLNSSKPPFDDHRIREALALGDREEINEIANLGLPTIATGPFAPGNVGNLEDSGWPESNLDRAKELVADYEEENGPAEFTLTSTPDPGVLQVAQLIQEQAKAAGIDVNLKSVEQAQLINDAIGGNFQAMTFRNHPGGDPDTQYNWWKSGSPVNFGRINDPEIDRLLDEGRSEPDPEKRKGIYEDLTRQFAKEFWNIWGWYTPWAIGTAADVNGVYGPDLPDGSKPSPGLAAGHPTLGMWIG